MTGTNSKFKEYVRILVIGVLCIHEHACMYVCVHINTRRESRQDSLRRHTHTHTYTHNNNNNNSSNNNNNKNKLRILFYISQYSLVSNLQRYLGFVERNSAFEHAQNVKIHILRMRKILSGPLFSIHTLCFIQCSFSRTVKALIRLRGSNQSGWTSHRCSSN